MARWSVVAQEVAESGVEVSEVGTFSYSWDAANYAKHRNANAESEEDKRIFYVAEYFVPKSAEG